MIDIPTVFILGAGASRPYGYPTGTMLRTSIIDNFRSRLGALLAADELFAGERRKQYLSAAEEFVRSFHKSSILSIDKFLALNPKYAAIGKLAIVTSILQTEKDSLFRENVEQPQEDWYVLLYNRMISDLSSPDSYKEFGKNKLLFITFNYDRSLEYFLYESFIHSFSQERVADLISLSPNGQSLIPFDFIHVYGQVDKVQWEGGSEYKAEHGFKKVLELSENIRVIGERTSNGSPSIGDMISKAKRVFFLGFGYAPENLEAIGVPNAITKENMVYGTAKGFTPNEIKAIRSLLQENFKHLGPEYSNPVISDCDCYQLLREYLETG